MYDIQNTTVYSRNRVSGRLSVDTRDAGGWTPLHESVFRNNSNCARLLLTHKADVNAFDSHGITALHIAAYKE